MSRSGFRGRRTADLNEISVLRPRIGPGFFKGRNGILRKKITEVPSIAAVDAGADSGRLVFLRKIIENDLYSVRNEAIVYDSRKTAFRKTARNLPWNRPNRRKNP